MKMSLTFLITFALCSLFLISCEQRAMLSPRIGRFIAAEYLLKIDGKENLATGIMEHLHEEQNLRHGILSSNTNLKYLPEKNPKFPLPYYLVPEEDAHFLFADSLDPNVADQLSMKISGKKHFKLFVHPDSEVYYNFLRASCNYVGPDQTEFFASPTSDYRSLVVWNRNNMQRKPFIAKVSLEKKITGNIDQLVSTDEVYRSISNQKVLDRIGEIKLKTMNLKTFPESAGLIIDKPAPGSSEKLGGQIIREIPHDILSGQKKWPSFSSLMSSNKKATPIIMSIIKKSGLSSSDFFKKYMIDNYLTMFEELSLKQGINFEPNSENLLFETTKDLQPTGNWVLRELAEFWPDVITMAKNGGPVNVYMESASSSKYKLRSGRSNYISSYVFFYKRQVFDMLLEQVAKYDPSLTTDEIKRLQETIDTRYTSLINSYLGLNLKAAPDMTNYQKIEEMVIGQTELDSKIEKKEIVATENLKTFIENKKSKLEWIQLAPKNGKSEYFLTDHGLYEISNKKVVAFALFNRNEMEDYKTHNKMLPSLALSNQTPLEKAGCFGLMADFFKEVSK